MRPNDISFTDNIVKQWKFHIICAFIMRNDGINGSQFIVIFKGLLYSKVRYLKRQLLQVAWHGMNF